MMVRRRSRSKQRQRGSIAAEFALVLPIFIGIVGLMISVGMSMLYRYQLLNYANVAARQCTNTIPVVESQLSTCIQSVLLELQPTALCSGMQVQPTLSTGPAINAKMNVLNVQITCNMPWFMVGTISAGQDAQTIVVKVNSAMPYLLL